MRFIFLLLFAIVVAHAEETTPLKLTPGAERALAAYDAKVLQMKNAYYLSLRAELDKLGAALHKEMDALTKKGDLDGALALKNKMKEIQEATSDSNADPLDEPLVITKVRYGVPGKYMDATNYFRGKIKKGKLDLPPSDPALYHAIGDPADGEYKQVIIEYIRGGVAGKAVFERDEPIKL